MPKYRLMQDNDEVKFNHTSDFNDLDNYNLKDIIKFTGVFKSEEELKNYLRKFSLIKNNHSLYVGYRFNHKDKKLQYGITYNEDIRFFDSINMKRFLEQNKFNIELLDRLCAHYKNSFINNGNVYAIRDYILKLKREQVALDDENEIVQNFKYVLNDFVKRECYRRNTKTSELKENFKGMRDLAMFLSYQSKKVEGLTFNNIDHLNDISEYVNNKKIKEEIILQEPAKQKTKQIPGQMSFIINNGKVDI